MTILSSYLFRQIWGLTLAMTLALSVLVLLTQSLRFLDLMISAGAAPLVFFQLLALSLPRLIEIVMPIALGVSVLIIGLKLQSDQELTVMQATGATPERLARPVLAAALLTSLVVGSLSLWLTPLALSTLQSARQSIQAQFSLSLLQPGVFNFFGDHIMVYFDRRDDEGRLVNLILHDQRDPAHPYTLMAERGALSTNGEAYRLDITNGRRQQLNKERGIADQLSFTRYGIELPKTIRDIGSRWKEPNERNLVELLTKHDVATDNANRMALMAELHRRLALFALPFTMALPVLWLVLTRVWPRAGTLKPSLQGLGLIGLLQALLLLAYSMAEDRLLAIGLIYALSIVPACYTYWLLRGNWQPEGGKA